MESAAASAFLKSVMGRLFVLLEKEYNKHRGLAQEAQSIQQDLRMIGAAMDDQIRALGRHQRPAIARLYSEEMLDLAHDIEDCVDRFTHRLSCKQRGGGSGAASSLARRVAHGLRKVQSRSSYADEIQKLKRRLKEAYQRVTNSVPLPVAYGGQPQPNGGSPPPSMVHALDSSSKPCRRVTRNPVGIEKPMEELLSLLHEVDGEPQQLRVISVVGFRGLGKTTLARAVYDSPHAKKTFNCRAWISSSKLFPKTAWKWMLTVTTLRPRSRNTSVIRGVCAFLSPFSPLSAPYCSDRQTLDIYVDYPYPILMFVTRLLILISPSYCNYQVFNCH
jgi:hypothetical protein